MKKIATLILSLLLFQTIGFAQTIPSYVSNFGLIGYWPFNGNANDLSSVANNGINNGASLGADRNNIPNSAYYFNGTNNQIVVPNNSNYNVNAISISLWAKWGGQNSWFPGIISKCSIVNQGWYIVINSSSLDSISFQGGISSGNYFNVSSSPIVSNQWVHLVGVYSNGVQKLYVNGALLDINQNSGLFPNNSEDIHIGLKNGDTYWNGAIDEVAIWNRELSQIEVNQIYNGCNISFLQQPQSLTLLAGQVGQITALCSDSSAFYQWQFNGGLGWQNLSNAGAFSGVNSSTLTVTANFSLNNFLFRCIVSDTSCSDTSSIATLIINGSVSILENPNEYFEINPNPAHNFLLLSNLNSRIQYKIFDSSGRLVKMGNAETLNSQIDINDLYCGFYVIQINNSKRKFVKY